MNKGYRNETELSLLFNWTLNNQSNCKATEGSDAVTPTGLGVSMKSGKASIPDHEDLLHENMSKDEQIEALEKNLSNHVFDLLSIRFDYRKNTFHLLFNREEGIEFLLQYPFRVERESGNNGKKLKFRFYFNMSHCKLYKPIKL